MKIGKYELYSIETSEFSLDGGAMFGIIPKTLWSKKAPSDELNRIEMVTRSLLLSSKGKKILIDTGNGTKWEDKYKDIYNINTEKYNIEYSLSRYGFTTNDITDVILFLYRKNSGKNRDINHINGYFVLFHFHTNQ